jgi:hypothetical protein
VFPASGDDLAPERGDPSVGTGNWSLEGMDVYKPLEDDILRQLTKGRRTVSELTEIIYGVDRQNVEYYAYYMKITRAMKALQRRGYVVSNIFGRDKPYRLTPYAAVKMIDVELLGKGLISPLDALTYIVTAALGLLNIVMAGQSWLTTPLTIALYTVFIFFAGYSSRLLWSTIKRVS